LLESCTTLPARRPSASSRSSLSSTLSARRTRRSVRVTPRRRGGGAVCGKAHLRPAGAASRPVRHQVQHRYRGGSRVPLELADHLQRDAGGRSGAHHDHVDRAASGVRHDSPQPRPVDLRQLLQPVDRMDDACEQDRARTRARLVHGSDAASRCLGTPRRQ
jgi:hypothetical protein